MITLKTLFRTATFLAICCSVFLSCGKEGPPRPKLYDLPASVSLDALQVGPAIRLTIPFPSRRVSGAPLESFESVECYALRLPLKDPRLPAAPPISAVVTSGNLVLSLPYESCQSFHVENLLIIKIDLSSWLAESAIGGVFISVVIRDDLGKRSAPSEIKGILTAIPPDPPSTVSAESSPDGVHLFWDPSECSVMGIEKLEPTRSFLGVIRDTTEFFDQQVQNGETCRYGIHCMGDIDGVWSSPSEVAITYIDRFPPPPVEDLVVSPLRGRMRVSWSPQKTAAGYKIYSRCGQEEPWTLVRETQDRFVELDPSSCNIAVSAVDAVGNESPKVTGISANE